MAVWMLAASLIISFLMPIATPVQAAGQGQQTEERSELYANKPKIKEINGKNYSF